MQNTYWHGGLVQHGGVVWQGWDVCELVTSGATSSQMLMPLAHGRGMVWREDTRDTNTTLFFGSEKQKVGRTGHFRDKNSWSEFFENHYITCRFVCKISNRNVCKLHNFFLYIYIYIYIYYLLVIFCLLFLLHLLYAIKHTGSCYGYFGIYRDEETKVCIFLSVGWCI